MFQTDYNNMLPYLLAAFLGGCIAGYVLSLVLDEGNEPPKKRSVIDLPALLPPKPTPPKSTPPPVSHTGQYNETPTATAAWEVLNYGDGEFATKKLK
jgi:hypothetical protein